MKLETYKTKLYTIYNYKYADIQDFLDSLISGTINRNVFGNILSSDNADYAFTGTQSFEEAWNLCKNGWNEYYDYFKSEMQKLDIKINYTSRKVKSYGVVGTSPNVPRYLLNLPDNMNRKISIWDKKTIDIYFNICSPWYVDQKQIINRGILTLSLIKYLESLEIYNVKLHFSAFLSEKNEIVILDVSLKKDNRKFDGPLLKKCFFPLVHPSFLRRLCFRALEMSNVTYPSWKEGYGCVMDYHEVKEILLAKDENFIYISSPNELEIRGYDIKEDLNSFLNNINSMYTNVEFDNRRQR